MPLRSEPVELGEIARAVAAEFELRARERATHDRRRPRRGAVLGAAATRTRVARVVRILIDNALRYGPRGRAGEVEARRRGRRGAASRSPTAAPGIPPEERERIFERFHRGSAAGAESGFGLGLAIGRELAAPDGRRARRSRTTERGARFALTLRAARSSPSTVARHRDSDRAAGYGLGRLDRGRPRAPGAGRWRALWGHSSVRSRTSDVHGACQRLSVR